MPALRSANRLKVGGKTNMQAQDTESTEASVSQQTIANNTTEDAEQQRTPIPTAPLSSKAKGKQRATGTHPWNKQPTGPFLNPFNQSTKRLSTLPREAQYYTTPRTWTLPTSRFFIDQLERDVRCLLDAWRSLQTPQLTTFAHLWKEHGWHLVPYTWGEDPHTREKFFRVVGDAFVTSFQGENSERASGAVFALFLLYELQPLAITPVPGLKGGEEHAEPHSIKIPLDAYRSMLTLPERLDEGDLQQDVAFAIRSLLGLAPESSHVGRDAFHVLVITAPRMEYEHVTLDQKQRDTGQFGHLVDEVTQTRLAVTRAELLLIRAAQALDVPLSTLFKDRIGDAHGQWKYVPPLMQRATLFDGKWIDRPLREFDAARLRKFTEVVRQSDGQDTKSLSID